MDIYKLVSAYYELGLQHKDIAHIISETHNRPISRRQVRRVLERQGLGRRQNYTDISDVIDVIRILLKGSAQLLGYRMMWRRLTHMGIHIRGRVRGGAIPRSRPKYHHNPGSRGLQSRHPVVIFGIPHPTR